MRGTRRLICIGALVAVATGAGASVATASTPLYVSLSGSDAANACTSAAAPCRTIKHAVEQSQLVSEVATIEVAAGVYEETVEVASAAETGLTIHGAGSGVGGTEILGPAGAATGTVGIGGGANAVTLSNVSVVNQIGDKRPGITATSDAAIEGVAVRMQDPSGASGIEAPFGSVTINGGGVTMESGTTGRAIRTSAASLHLDNATILVMSGSTAGAITTESGPMSIGNTVVNLESKTASSGIIGTFTPVSLAGVSVVQNSEGNIALGWFFPAPATLSGVSVSMTNPKNTSPAVVALGGTATISHLTLGGTWAGPGLSSGELSGGRLTVADSRIVASPASTAPALIFEGLAESSSVLVQRSVLQANAGAVPGAVVLNNANAAIDSSEVLGGVDGVSIQHKAGKTRTVTIAASTIDAGELGVADPPGVRGVDVFATELTSSVKVLIEGSIVLEQQSAGATSPNAASVTCTASDMPSQAQAAKGGEGAIACASGTNGNRSSALASLFASPFTNYQLNPSSSAVDSVPASAITLASPSSFDLAGNPRVVDGNGDCLAVQDRGALELQGHAVACSPVAAPGPVIGTSKPTPGVISALTISPSAFSAARPGAAISGAGAAKKKKYGATVSYRDSKAATTTFTVLAPMAGRTQGRSCRKPTKANGHGRRCTLYKVLGSFTHADTAGANSLHFSGRLHGKKLAKGSYRLQAIPNNAAGNGAAVTKSFAIK